MESSLTELKDKFAELVKYIEDMKASNQLVIENNRILKKQITDIREENSNILYSVYELEKNMTRLNQYSRRENLEIMNIPESIPQRELESTIINLLNSVNINVCSYDVVAVHRVGKKPGHSPRNVIIRFINRKDPILIMRRRYQIEKAAKSFNLNGIRFIENLCPENKKIFNRCYKLKKENSIQYVGSYNGSVFIQLHGENEDIFVDHYDDIDDALYQENNVSTYFDSMNETSVTDPVINNNDSLIIHLNK